LGGHGYTRLQMSDPGALDALERALATVIDPELHKPMLQLGMLRDLAVAGGVASVRVVLTTPACPLKDRIKADIDAGLADVAAGRVKDFDATRIVERGRKLLADRSSSA